MVHEHTRIHAQAKTAPGKGTQRRVAQYFVGWMASSPSIHLSLNIMGTTTSGRN